MTRAPVVGIAVVLLALAALAGWAIGRRRPAPTLPPAVATAVEHERADRARVDSQLIAASLEAVAAAQRQAIAEARADSLRSIARKLSDYADRLAQKAEKSVNAADSATYYREAYEVRTDERDSLQAAVGEMAQALDAADARAAALQAGLFVADSARQRADSVLDAVVASVTVCTVPGTFGRVKCPTRRQALVAGVVLTVAGKLTYDAVRDGRLHIPLRLP